LQKVKKPWGEYIDYSRHEHYVVKLIRVYPGEIISLQEHKDRSEHWIVVSGEGTLTVQKNKKSKTLMKKKLKPNDYIYIEKEHLHRVFVPSYGTTLEIMEIQYGKCSEKDIVRVEDKYGRS
jgi:mannose-6-phosphate isomerase-like protein (cupin superfamily)